MQLNILNRIILQNILPQKGTLSEQIICKDIIEKIKLSQGEILHVGLKDIEGTRLVWDKEKETILDINFSNAEINTLKQIVVDIDNNKGVTPDMVDLCIAIKALEAKTTE